MVVLLSQIANAYDFMVDDIYYNSISENTACVTYKYTNEDMGGDDYESGYSGDVVIPSTVNYNGKTYTVVGIGSHTFYGDVETTSVTIPNTVKWIGSNAFTGCRLIQSLIIPNSVTLMLADLITE